MDTSPFFLNGTADRIAKELKQELNAHSLECPEAFRDGTSAMGNAIEGLVGRKLKGLLSECSAASYSVGTTHKALGDIVFRDADQFLISVDVKSQCVTRKFQKPNLISAERLKNYLMQDGEQRHFSLLLVRYAVQEGILRVYDVLFHPISWVPWKDLAIENQGKGVMQLRSGARYELRQAQDRDEWIVALHHQQLNFYLKLAEIARQRAENMRREIEQLGPRLSTMSGREVCTTPRMEQPSFLPAELS